MDGPPDNPRICAIAKRLSPLPPELIAPIIADQQLHRVLELSLVPTAGPSLLWAIKNSLQWKWLLVREDGTNQLEELQRLFKSINLLSWTWCRQVAVRIPAMAKRYHLDVDSGSKTISLGQLQEEFLSVFRDLLPVPGRHKRLRGLRDIMTRIESAEAPENIHTPKLEECMKSKEPLAELASTVASHNWTADQAQTFLPYLAQAFTLQAQAKSHELHRLADLYEVFPAELKEPFAPQERRGDAAKQHILGGLRRDAQRVLTKPIRTSGKVDGSSNWNRRSYPYRFRYPHPALVPADWVLGLICLALERYPLPEDGGTAGAESSEQGLRYPPELLPDLRQCARGLPHILEFSGISAYARYRQLSGPSFNVAHLSYLKKTKEVSPHCYAELDWLEALLRCVSWIKGEAPELVQESLKTPNGKVHEGAKALSTGEIIQSPGATSLVDYAPILTPEDYEAYISREPAEVIAQQLRLDSSLSSGDLDHLPSLLALYLPRIPSERARDIAACLLPGADRSVRELTYQDMVKKAQKAIRKHPIRISYEDYHGYTYHPQVKDWTTDLSAEGTWGVLRDYAASKPALSGGPLRYCYVCQTYLSHAHKVFPRMCEPCGEFNIAGSAVSLPPNLKLGGKVALVTGGRINLGFHTALRLLRCGAAVIVSTRYPEDAVTRYENESDFAVWKDRLKIIGADFRAAGDAFQLVEQVRNLVGQMGGVLHILINNAAQTLTDSVRKEQDAVSREKLLKGQEADKPILITHSYEPRVRGVSDHRLIESSDTEASKLSGQITEDSSKKNTSALAGQATDLSSPVAQGEDGPSSWVQSLADIPYEDVISAHSVNTFVPLILIRELMPLMNHEMRPSYSPSSAGPPLGYIVNVSSREGLFEKSAKSQAKNGKHVHTNMSKAGLNMITETEAYPAWRRAHVAINTVDPGYMSAAPEFEYAHGGERPLGWEDGAGRVLWPIAMGERTARDKKSAPVWGRFLKHYGATRVDVRLGRG
ncbi:hypothetical protein PG993_004594 [Apiospora rasikravindrae]|uniref:Uncharacterized protein n=1 Tax=Apiospora rasikravindrae TaxID=990691 RepID=A0ABR1TF90_9PEZI